MGSEGGGWAEIPLQLDALREQHPVNVEDAALDHVIAAQNADETCHKKMSLLLRREKAHEGTPCF